MRDSDEDWDAKRRIKKNTHTLSSYELFDERYLAIIFIVNVRTKWSWFYDGG